MGPGMTPLADADLVLSPRVALDLVDGAPLADVFELALAPDEGSLDQLLEVQA
jgi:hypothetical protein